MADSIRTCLSLFSGGGGLDLGVRIANPDVRVVGHVEWEAYAATELLARMEDKALEPAPIWCGDIRSFDTRPYQGMVDLICGGPPCQPFRRNGWPAFLAVVADVRPGWVFAEHVPGSLPYYYAAVRPRLQGLGYRVTEGLFTAAEVGAPHLRERLFILASTQWVAISQPPSSGRYRASADAGSTGRDMADAERSGYDGRAREQRRRSERGPPAKRSGARPPFPPGPNDGDAWRAVLERWPELAPATAKPEVRRVADGLAGGMGGHRTDQLRVFGNGVVPLCAAKAFIVLRERLLN